MSCAAKRHQLWPIKNEDSGWAIAAGLLQVRHVHVCRDDCISRRQACMTLFVLEDFLHMDSPI